MTLLSMHFDTTKSKAFRCWWSQCSRERPREDLLYVSLSPSLATSWCIHTPIPLHHPSKSTQKVSLKMSGM